MPREFIKKPEVITREEIRRNEQIIKTGGGTIEGLISMPTVNTAMPALVKEAIKFLVDKCGYSVRKKDRVGTHKTTWKRFERTVALFFGAKRVPLSGSNSGHGTNSDSLHPLVYIESKYRKHAFSVVDLFLDTERKAEREGKIPVVALKQKDVEGYFLMIRPEDLGLLNQLKELSSDINNLDGLEVIAVKSKNGKRITKEIRRTTTVGKDKH